LREGFFRKEKGGVAITWDSMRVSGASVFFPAALACVAVFGRGFASGRRHWALVVALLQPAALLIDHGHFQYNSISLGLSVRCVARDRSRGLAGEQGGLAGKWTHCQTGGPTGGRTDRRTDGRTGGPTDGQIERPAARRTDGRSQTEGAWV
jgi:ALG6, ALG8 glycosyltransferase family